MKKLFIIPLLLVLLVGLCAPPVSAQATGTVKGIAKDIEGKPIAQADLEWFGVETGRKYNLKTNNKGEYFSLGISPGKYNVKLSKDGKELFHFNGVTVGLDEFVLDFDLKKEQERTAQGQGMTAEQIKQVEEAKASQAKEQNTVKSLNDKLKAASEAKQAGNYDQAISLLTEANQIDATRDLIWYSLGDSYRMSATKQTDPAEKDKRYEMALADYQKAIEIKKADQKDPETNKKLAAYYNNLADVYARTHKVDDAVKTYELASQLDPAGVAGYNYNIGVVYHNAGRADDAVAAFDKVIAADPNKADAYYLKGVDMLAKATFDKANKMVAPPGTAEAFQKYLELQPNGPNAEPAKAMLANIGATVETSFGTTKKKAVKK
jgi:tetratricopeptide (TPR) repeat protein